MNLRDLDVTDNPGLKSIIFDRIRAAGPISFAEYYELAMYHPRHGYYFACDPTRDFQSSPNVHPVFGACIARQLASFWRTLDRPVRFDAFEAGAGSGRLASDVLSYLRSTDSDFFDAIRYVVQDVSLSGDDPWRRLEAVDLPRDKVSVAASLPDTAQVEGCILSNELLDALPFRRLRRRDGHLYELLVGLQDGRLADIEAEPRPDVLSHFEALGSGPADGCEAEVCLAAPAWTARAARALRRGYILTLDYGYEAPDLYASWRKRGTLLTFYRQTSGDDPYARIGRQDITASVDFTSVRRAGEAAGLQHIGTSTQSEFLAALGIGEALATPPAPDQIEAYYALRKAVVELTDASGLGRIKVLFMGKNVPGYDAAPFASTGS
ncbi:MAG TPA: SAM-dependent methyltransferase [Dehalococcoidia bacterium]|nr:SAM-dependent methyltransferase [Dehalococcoidia bacterium]